MKKITKKRGFKYLVSFLMMLSILLAMTVQPMITNLWGTEILIKTKPFDPRDIFRGDYVRLYYDINEITLEHLNEDILQLKDSKEEYDPYSELEGKKLYVTLKKDKDYYEVDKVTLKKPKEGLFIKAMYSHPLFQQEGIGKVNGIVVEYRLDKYFIPENTGKELEDKALKGELLAKIKVYRGYGLLKEISDK